MNLVGMGPAPVYRLVMILVRNWGPFSGTEFWLHKGGDPQCLGPRRVVEGEHQRVQQNRTTRAQIVIYFVTIF